MVVVQVMNNENHQGSHYLIFNNEKGYRTIWYLRVNYVIETGKKQANNNNNKAEERKANT